MSIELPRDAEGREIPLDTEVLYDKDGHPKDVSLFTYAPRSYSSGWNVVLVGGFERFASAMNLTPPDSWEKLEEDLRRAAERDVVTSHCRYFNAADRCAACPIYNSVDGCTHVDERAFGDILDRIRKLRGEGE